MAATLFGCVSNEHENLRPRAVAALDSLLAAYRRMYGTCLTEEVNGGGGDGGGDGEVPLTATTVSVDANPWATPPSPSTAPPLTPDVVMEDASSSQPPNDIRLELARSLTPLLWNVACGPRHRTAQ